MIIPLSPLPIANAAKITVPTDFPTIQEAIDAANDGDTINVLAGTYTEQLSINKDLKIIGAGAKSTIIDSPAILETNFLGLTYLVQVTEASKVSMKEFTIDGGPSCNVFFGITVFEDANLTLDSSTIKGCIARGIQVGSIFGPQTGHTTVTNSEISGYGRDGIFAIGEGSTIKVFKSKITGVGDPAPIGQQGIQVLFGAKGTILNSKVSGNICEGDPACGPDYFTQIQGFGIVAFNAATGSAISNNDISDNDIGIAVAGNGGCCKIVNNKLKDNEFFGIIMQDGKHTSVNDKISGGNIGIAAVAIDTDTTATLVHDKITGTTTPTQEFECCGFNAEIITIPPNSFQSSQFNSAQSSEVDPDFLKKKFGLEDSNAVGSPSTASPF